MNLRSLIKQRRAHRNLRHSEHYQKISRKNGDLPSYVNEIVLQENEEEAIGIYENFQDERNESIAITTLGLHIFLEGRWVFIGYHQISEIETPEKKLSVKELVTHLNSGEIVKIPVKGGGDRTRDVWSFLHFLMHVIDDIRKRAE